MADPRIEHRTTTPKNPMVNSTDVTLVTSGQSVTPRNGGYGGSAGVGLKVRGSPCRPLCMLIRASTAKATKAVNVTTHPNRPDRGASWSDRHCGASSITAWPSFGDPSTAGRMYLTFDPQVSSRRRDRSRLEAAFGRQSGSLRAESMCAEQRLGYRDRMPTDALEVRPTTSGRSGRRRRC